MNKKHNPQKVKRNFLFSSHNRGQVLTAMVLPFAALFIAVVFSACDILPALAASSTLPDSIVSEEPPDTSEIVSVVETVGPSELETLPEPVSIVEEALPDVVLIDSVEVLQMPELLNGCEIASLTAALISAGFEADKLVLADEYLPQSESYWGADPELVYMGNPRYSSGWYCFEPPIVEAADKFLSDFGSAMRAQAVNLNPDALIEKLACGIPVIAWITTDMRSPRHSVSAGWTGNDGEWFSPYVNVHCVLVVGFDILIDEITFMDPMGGFRNDNIATFFSIYEELGSRSVTIEF